MTKNRFYDQTHHAFMIQEKK